MTTTLSPVTSRSLPSLQPVSQGPGAGSQTALPTFAGLTGPSLLKVRFGGVAISLQTPKEARNGAVAGWVQLRLGLEVDGKFGPITDAAIRAFQKAQGLPETGVIDAALLDVLDKKAPGAVAQANPGTGPTGYQTPLTTQILTEGKVIGAAMPALQKNGGATAWVQDRLGLKVDGKFGLETQTGIQNFQKAQGLPPTGLIDAALLTALKARGRPVKVGPLTNAPVRTGKFPKPAMAVSRSANFDTRGGAKIDTIVLHYTGGPRTGEAGDLNTLTKPNTQVSAHFLVTRDGKITQLVAEELIAFHAGQSYFQGEDRVNERSLGIEIANEGDTGEPYTPAQMAAVTKLVGYLREKYQVQLDNITGHSNVAMPVGRKSDPGAHFDMAGLKRALVA